ncbi:MAG: glutamine-hydrolyzing carbamoyl-phosphate synthase small subunit [Candidatus Peribacteraceae bacterium]|nr:glutamine-hydrolyzing carbamoyl-phosphate synthase small subunit [Candidatus Peribacteraceae bacterium]
MLTLADGTVFSGESFGAVIDVDGEVVFNTGMAGYPESLTDPSYRGQILVFTYPLIGNYGVPSAEMNEWGFSKNFESEAVHVRGVVVSQVSEDFSHFKAVSSLGNWLEHHKIPGITGVDTRALTQKLREHGVMLGRIQQSSEGMREPGDIPDPNLTNLVAEVSCKEVMRYEPKEKADHPHTIIAYDCGMKRTIIRSFLKRGVTVVRVPWDFDLDSYDASYDAVFISNGPGDPKMCQTTIVQIRKAIERKIPTFGICLGNQLLALAVGGDTFKLKYGHRSANQPCIEHDASGKPTHKCIITSQNHGFAVKPELPAGWRVWFTNANDGTIEGIRHESGKFFSVQFHPEATPGPEDANYLFDEFLAKLK